MASTGWLSQVDKRRFYTLLFALYFALAVFAMIFHSHHEGSPGDLHDDCGFCQVVQAGGLADGAGHVPVVAAVSLPLLVIAFIAFHSAFRPLFPRYLSSAHNRAPPRS